MSTITLSPPHILCPAYGQDFSTEHLVKQHFWALGSFSTHSGTIVSIRDFRPNDVITLQYANKTKSCQITL